MSSPDDAIESGILKLTRHRLLTHDEEIRLSNLYRHRGDTKARDRLIEMNMRLVVDIAKGWTGNRIALEDMVQEGAIGLITAAERYDPKRGYRFSTYATHWIKQAINRAIDNKSRAIRKPSHVCETIRKIDKTIAELINNDMAPTVKAIAERVGISEKKVRQYIEASKEPVSLSTLVGKDENATLQDLVLVDHRPEHNPVASLDLVANREEMDEFLASLNERERDVMEQRVGYDDDEAKVFETIGQSLHVSRERIRQVEIKALKKLRKSASRIRQRDENALNGVSVQHRERIP